MPPPPPAPACWGLPAGSGTLVPGALADITLFDTCGLDWVASRDPVNHLVMAEQGHNVKHVVVHGRLVLQDRKAAHVDEAALVSEAAELAAADDHANAPWLAITAGERAVYAELIEKALAQRLQIERHARLR